MIVLQSSVSLQLGTDLLVSAAAALVTIIVILYLYFVVWALHKKPVTGVEALKGKVGVATGDFANGKGEVSVDGVIWEAKSSSNSQILKGENVVVVGVLALELLVQKQ